ncbi:MAG: twitching motility protein PilT [Clostridiales bacterium]|nr:twitching motility protein PilT [Clostridiales bacterium]
MVQIIAGEKGKGKTKYLLDMVNNAVAHATGNIVYLDKSQKHMHELTNKVRLINVAEYPITNMDEFLGFICGIVSQDYDLQEMYLDSFLTIAGLDDDQLVHAIEKLDVISEKYSVKFVLSISRNEADLPESVQARVLISL